jgi:hypothetical protein
MTLFGLKALTAYKVWIQSRNDVSDCDPLFDCQEATAPTIAYLGAPISTSKELIIVSDVVTVPSLPQKLRVRSAIGGEMTVTWDESQDTGGMAINSYRIFLTDGPATIKSQPILTTAKIEMLGDAGSQVIIDGRVDTLNPRSSINMKGIHLWDSNSNLYKSHVLFFEIPREIQNVSYYIQPFAIDNRLPGNCSMGGGTQAKFYVPFKAYIGCMNLAQNNAPVGNAWSGVQDGEAVPLGKRIVEYGMSSSENAGWTLGDNGLGNPNPPHEDIDSYKVHGWFSVSQSEWHVQSDPKDSTNFPMEASIEACSSFCASKGFGLACIAKKQACKKDDQGNCVTTKACQSVDSAGKCLQKTNNDLAEVASKFYCKKNALMKKYELEPLDAPKQTAHEKVQILAKVYRS